MRIVLVMIVLIAALGFYLGWFNFSSRNDKGESNVTLSVDKHKIEADKNIVVEKVQELGQKADTKTAPTTRKTTD